MIPHNLATGLVERPQKRWIGLLNRPLYEFIFDRLNNVRFIVSHQMV